MGNLGFLPSFFFLFKNAYFFARFKKSIVRISKKKFFFFESRFLWKYFILSYLTKVTIFEHRANRNGATNLPRVESKQIKGSNFNKFFFTIFFKYFIPFFTYFLKVFFVIPKTSLFDVRRKVDRDFRKKYIYIANILKT